MDRSDLMDVILRLKAEMALKPTISLTAGMHAMFSSSGCDPHCHFCFEALNVGDQFGFKRLKVGISGTACARCIKEDRPTPVVALDEAEERRVERLTSLQGSTPQLPPAPRRGFLFFD